jgi:23S rRNA pseudouridine1911/1915/1917 synthase
MSESLAVLYEDNHCLAVAKPAPLLTQGVPPGIPTLEAMVKAYLKEKYNKAGNVYLGIPHRLDRPVSGVVLFARNTKAARRIAEQFKERTVRKLYWALVEGEIPEPEGRWEDWMVKLPEEARSMLVAADIPGAQLATLSYRRLWSDGKRTLLEVNLETGRMHQIRVQAASRGHPVMGDVLYGSQMAFGPATELARDRIIAMHARQLTFLHPIRFEEITVTAPLPETWPSHLLKTED